METATALANENTARKIRESNLIKISIPDIQYQEAVLEIIEKNEKINILILNSMLPGELNIFEFINLIKYKRPQMEIIIILEKKNNKIEQFLISKGINNIYYNNKITIKEIIEKIQEINNKNLINYKIEKLEKLILEKNKNKYLNKIINKINYLKNKIKNKNNKINNNKKTKIISIIGAPKVGKSIFILFLSLLIKNKKILIVDFSFKKNNIEKLIGKKLKNNKKEIFNKINWKKNIDFLIVSEDDYTYNHYDNQQNLKSFIEKSSKDYEYVFVDVGQVIEKQSIIKNSTNIILIVEANLLGINETHEILEEVVKQQKTQKDNIKIVFNKHNKESINNVLLKIMFSDFEIFGKINYESYYNKFINKGSYLIPKKIKKKFEKIIEKIK